MSPNLTTCPNCGHQFDAGEAMQKHLEIELKKNFEAQEKANALKLEELKKQMAEEKRIFEQEEKKKMWATLTFQNARFLMPKHSFRNVPKFFQ